MRTDSGVGDPEDLAELPLWEIRTEYHETRIYWVEGSTREDALLAWNDRMIGSGCDEILDDEESLLTAELAE